MIGTKRYTVPPKEVKCFRCEGNFYISYIVPRKRYSQKNDWGFWTGEKSEKKICNSCLRSFYLNEKPLFWEQVKDLKKRRLLSNYMSNGSI